MLIFFKYSILLILLHYYEISFHPEIISKLKPFEKQHNFIHITLTKFETYTSNVLLTIFDQHKNKIYHTKNDSANKAYIPQLKVKDMLHWNLLKLNPCDHTMMQMIKNDANNLNNVSNSNVSKSFELVTLFKLFVSFLIICIICTNTI